jgi:hypothetical protein
MACVELVSAMKDCRLVLTDVVSTGVPDCVAMMRMGQLQYQHAPQLLQADEPDVDHVPALHNLHVVESVAAMAAEYVPPTH